MALDKNRRCLSYQFVKVFYGKPETARLIAGSIFKLDDFDASQSVVGGFFAIKRAVQAQC